MSPPQKDKFMSSLVINFFGGPGSGKSSYAYALSAEMKKRGMECELITEYAKELTHRKDFDTLSNQFFVSAEQDRRQRQYLDKTDYIITDSPVILGLVYTRNTPPSFEDFLLDNFSGYNNLNFFVRRDLNIPYNPNGRSRSLETSMERDRAILDILNRFRIPYTSIKHNQLERIFDKLK